MKTKILIALIPLLSSCARTTHTLYDPITGHRIQRTVLPGDYGAARQTTAPQNRFGGKGVVEYRPNRIVTCCPNAAITIRDGELLIAGPVNHSRATKIQAEAGTKIVKNLAMLAGVWKTVDVVEGISAQREITKRALQTKASVRNGTDGTNGADGTNGTNGTNGTDGTNGNNGNNGHGNNGNGNNGNGNNGNNGHGNNTDGVDSSNPGNGHGGPNGGSDTSGVDDEN